MRDAQCLSSCNLQGGLEGWVLGHKKREKVLSAWGEV